MERKVEKLARGFATAPTGELLAALNKAASTFNFATTPDQIERELRYFLTSNGKKPQHAPAFKASPWCNYFAIQEHNLEQTWKHLAHQAYPDDPDLQLALENVITEFGSVEIWRQMSAAMSELFAVQRVLTDLSDSIKCFTADSSLQPQFRKFEPELAMFSNAIAAEITLRAQVGNASIPPLRVRRLQRALHFSVQYLCKPNDGPKRLASFIVSFLKTWPEVPAGMDWNLENHFDEERRNDLAKGYAMQTPQSHKEARALSRVITAVIFRPELRGPLLSLAYQARQRAAQRRKGWEHLGRALNAVFTHIRRETSDEAKFRNFERANFPYMRNLTREQRIKMLPELGNDPDPTVRDLTKRERMILAARHLKNPRFELEFDSDGRNSFSTRYGRAMKAIRKELGFV